MSLADDAPIVIVGGGLTGLVAAYTLHQNNVPFVLLEANSHWGGVIQSKHRDGYLIEMAANTFIGSARDLLDVIKSLGLTLETSNPIAKNRFIFSNKTLHAVPTSPLSFLGSSLMSSKGKWELVSEPFKKNAPADDESMTDFITRRLGRETLDKMVSPFLSGVYAGDSDRLSIQAVFPKLAQWEVDHGSLFAGAFAMMQAKKKTKPEVTSKNKKSSHQLYSFKDGMQTLTDALRKTLPDSACHLNAAVNEIKKNDTHYDITLAKSELTFTASHIILTTPAYISGALLKPIDPFLTGYLQQIEYAPISVVHLGVPKHQIPHPLDGFGCLIPRTEGIDTLGCIWNSQLFSNRAPETHHLLTCFIGGATNPIANTLNDETLVENVSEDLKQIFNTDTITPNFSNVCKWNNAIPQYNLGHTKRIEAIEANLKQHKGLHLAGNYLHGVALNHCITSAQGAATACLNH